MWCRVAPRPAATHLHVSCAGISIGAVGRSPHHPGLLVVIEAQDGRLHLTGCQVLDRKRDAGEDIVVELEPEVVSIVADAGNSASNLLDQGIAISGMTCSKSAITDLEFRKGDCVKPAERAAQGWAQESRRRLSCLTWLEG